MACTSPSKSPEAHGAPHTDKGNEDDRYDEPDANIRNFAPVARIMKNALPENAKIAKEAKECMQECVSEFISFITSEGKTPQKETYDVLLLVFTTLHHSKKARLVDPDSNLS